MKQSLAFRLAKRLERQRSDIGKAVLMLVAADELRRLHEMNVELLGLVKRYRIETPLGHQPHMIALVADEAIAKATEETE